MEEDTKKPEEVIINSEISSPEKKLDLITDESLLGMYGEILNNLRDDRKQVSELVDTFADMVINEGDSSNSSKEALVELMKTKIDTADKMGKIAVLMTQVKMKQPDTFIPYKNKDKGTTVNIYDGTGMNKRSLLEEIKKKKKEQK